MAEIIKRQYNIVALKVEMLQTRPNVLFTLQAKVDGELATIRTWPSDISELGVRPEKREDRNDVEGTLPHEMISYVQEWMRDAKLDDAPLWIHVVRPYGALRFMPWERAFGAQFGHPILMLPDFLFPPPRESDDTLDVVLCASAPLYVEDGNVGNALVAAAEGIRAAAVRSTNLHIFTDNAFYQGMHDHLATLAPPNGSVTVYDPQDASPFCSEDVSSRLVDQSGQLRSPWLLWMQHSLRSRSVDVVHMLGHSHLARDRGAMLLAQSPLERTNEFSPGPVSAIELSNFMTRVGAWGTVLTGVVDNNSPSGMRALADEIGQTRPGPVVMHSLARDPQQSFLPVAYRVVFDDAPMAMPVNDSLFVYCQPYRVIPPDDTERSVQDPPRTRGSRTRESPVSRNRAQTAMVEASSSDSSPLDQVIQRGGPVKPWVAATERVAEQVQLTLQNNARDDGDVDDSMQRARATASLSALDSLRQSVASFAAEDAAAENSPPGATSANASATINREGEQ